MISHRLGVGSGLEIGVALWAAPKMTDMPLIPILGPFGGNQLIVALSAVHPEVGTTIGSYRHGTPLLSRFHEMARRGNGMMAIRWGFKKLKTFSNLTEAQYKESLYPYVT